MKHLDNGPAGCQGHIVVEAEACHAAAGRMVARWPYERKGAPAGCLWVQHCLHGLQTPRALISVAV